jgi:peroxiredoxin
MLVALRDSLSAQKLDVVFVSVDEPETYGAAVDFATTRGVEAPILVASRPLGPFKSAMSPQWPGMLPATFLFDEQGKLRYFWGGPVYEEELLPIVERYLAGEEVDGYAKVPLRRGKDFRQD